MLHVYLNFSFFRISQRCTSLSSPSGLRLLSRGCTKLRIWTPTRRAQLGLLRRLFTAAPSKKSLFHNHQPARASWFPPQARRLSKRWRVTLRNSGKKVQPLNISTACTWKFVILSSSLLQVERPPWRGKLFRGSWTRQVNFLPNSFISTCHSCPICDDKWSSTK